MMKSEKSGKIDPMRLFMEYIGGIYITDEAGEVLYKDEKTAFIGREKTNWEVACPPAREGQSCEVWDLLRADEGRTYMVITSSFSEEGKLLRIHQLVETSMYTDLYRDISDYSKDLKLEKEHDDMTGLYNKGKFLELKKGLFRRAETIALFNMDLNNLKRVNDTRGHEAGDMLIKKAAESLKMVERRNILPFRVGGDEFILVGLHLSPGEAEQLRLEWEEGLRKLNERDDDLPCVIACGLVYGEKGFDLEALLAEADRRMYEHKQALKAGSNKG